MKCRGCGTEAKISFVDLNHCPPSNSFLRPSELDRPEQSYPLNVVICDHCWLAQVDEFKSHAEIFSSEYVYFSSYSSTWLKHAQEYVEHIASNYLRRADPFWVEIASNDGYLLQYVAKRGIPCLGIEPTESTASEARKKGIETISQFFGVQLATSLRQQNRQADVITANNVLAHVPNIHDFLAGFRILLKQDGIATFEFPHLMMLLRDTQFDTIYHEHFSYLSLTAINPILRSEGLRAFKVSKLSTHGGSLRLFVCLEDSTHSTDSSISDLLQEEEQAGLKDLNTYRLFQERVDAISKTLSSWLREEKASGRKVVGYGAAAKGNTLLNYSGIGPNLLSAVADASPRKQGLYLPGSRIPVVSIADLKASNPDTVLILPWNLADEISAQLKETFGPSIKIAVAVPTLKFL